MFYKCLRYQSYLCVIVWYISLNITWEIIIPKFKNIFLTVIYFKDICHDFINSLCMNINSSWAHGHWFRNFLLASDEYALQYLALGCHCHVVWHPDTDLCFSQDHELLLGCQHPVLRSNLDWVWLFCFWLQCNAWMYLCCWLHIGIAMLSFANILSDDSLSLIFALFRICCWCWDNRCCDTQFGLVLCVCMSTRNCDEWISVM